MNKAWKTCLLFFLIPFWGTAQEYLTPPGGNPLVRKAFLQARELAVKKSGPLTDTLDLPFFDDFSGTEIYPDQAKWSDRHAFINSTLAANLISIGAATLDVVDSTGTIHAHAVTQPFVSEYLTSRPIDLDLPVGSGVFLSFYYQPGGNANPPQTGDSLVLESHSPLTGGWERAWSSPGYASDSFRLAILPVNDPKYLTRGFRFRFKNIASLNIIQGLPEMTGNQDFWHIDYVYLDRNRSPEDTIFTDVAYVKPLRSLLRNYESIPWLHFSTASLVEMGSTLGITYRNNGDDITNVTRFFEIRDMFNGSLVHSYTGGADNIEAFETLFYNSNLIYSFASPAADSALFEVKSYLITDDNDFKGNDTIRYYQRFYNYYAYDDGTPEGGYVVNGEGSSSAMVAVRFRTYVPDTLQAVDIFFNQTYQNASREEFTLAVWNDAGGLPGNLIYQQEGMLPEYGEEIYEFYTYRIDEPFQVSGIFYVGWIQKTDRSLNIGMDLSRDRSEDIYYYLSKNGIWANTSFSASLMIRPVMGKRLPVSVDGNLPAAPVLKVFPNPARDILRLEFDFPDPGRPVHIELINSQGQQLKSYSCFSQEIDVSHLPSGIYFLRIIINGRYSGTWKILIAH